MNSRSNEKAGPMPSTPTIEDSRMVLWTTTRQACVLHTNEGTTIAQSVSVIHIQKTVSRLILLMVGFD
jgi:hypothetical protein